MGEPWKPVPVWAMALFAVAAIVFWTHALLDEDGFLLLDHINLPVHEFGHLPFSMLGDTLGALGGTLMQLIVPAAFFGSFFMRGETNGAAFCAFWFGENFLNIATYVADARAMELPLVGGGEHDWNTLLGWWGLLRYDTAMGMGLRALGWGIMLAAVLWHVYMGWSTRDQQDEGFG